MTRLRKMMLEELQRRNYSAITTRKYLRVVTEYLEKPVVWVFPELVVCLNCGFAEFVVAATELRRLVEIDSTCS